MNNSDDDEKAIEESKDLDNIDINNLDKEAIVKEGKDF